ncbi:MAG TPA: glycogen/starch synthase, partial [Phycisphaerae bacterium]
MRVFMLGWEFPPMVSGGLGVACYGLVKALNSMSVDVLFLVPKPLAKKIGGNGHSHHAPPQSKPQIRQIPAASPAEVQHAVQFA